MADETPSKPTDSSGKAAKDVGLSEPKLMLTLDERVIALKKFSWVSNGVIGCMGLQTDGSWRAFVENENPTEREFYGLDESIRSLPFEEKRLIVLNAIGLDKQDEVPWLEYDNAGPIPGQVESALLDSWLESVVSFEEDRFEIWGATTASQYAPGFEIVRLLDAKDREHLGLREADRGSPASWVPCVAMTASIERFNELMEARGLPYMMVDDEGPLEE